MRAVTTLPGAPMDRATARCRDVMEADPPTLAPDLPTLDAMEWLLDQQLHGAPVVDEGGHLVGVLSELDGIRVARAAWVHDLPAPTVDRVMTREVVVAHEDTPVVTVAHLLVAHRIRTVPIVDAQLRLVGVVRRPAVLRSMLQDMQPESAASKPGLYLSATREVAPARVETGRER